MPRTPRADEKGALYHALNRANGRTRLFRKAADYEAFSGVVASGLERYRVSLFCFQWMPNHWHMVLRPERDGEMSRFLRWVTATHTMRYHAHYHTSGQGHIYQGRFKSFPIADDDHFVTVCRYVERNAGTGRPGEAGGTVALGLIVALVAKRRVHARVAVAVADPARRPLDRTRQSGTDCGRVGRLATERAAGLPIRRASVGGGGRQATRPRVDVTTAGSPSGASARSDAKQ